MKFLKSSQGVCQVQMIKTANQVEKALCPQCFMQFVEIVNHICTKFILDQVS